MRVVSRLVKKGVTGSTVPRVIITGRFHRVPGERAGYSFATTAIVLGSSSGAMATALTCAPALTVSPPS